MVMTSLQTAGCLVQIGSAPRLRRVLTTQSVMGKRKSIRLSTGTESPCNTTHCMFKSAFFSLTVKSFSCSFLCLVPDEAKSSYHVEGTGYDTYLRDAHRQVTPSLLDNTASHQLSYVPLVEQTLINDLISSRTIVESVSTGTGGGTRSLLRSVT